MTLMTDRKVSLSTTVTVESQLALAAAYPITDNPLLDGVVREIGIALMAEVGHSLDPHEVHDAVLSLIDIDQRLIDLDDDPNGYLNSIRRPQTTEQHLYVEADLRSDRNAALTRLLDLR